MASDLGNTLALQEDLSGREFRGASSGRRWDLLVSLPHGGCRPPGPCVRLIGPNLTTKRCHGPFHRWWPRDAQVGSCLGQGLGRLLSLVDTEGPWGPSLCLTTQGHPGVPRPTRVCAGAGSRGAGGAWETGGPHVALPAAAVVAVPVSSSTARGSAGCGIPRPLGKARAPSNAPFSIEAWGRAQEQPPAQVRGRSYGQFTREPAQPPQPARRSAQPLRGAKLCGARPRQARLQGPEQLPWAQWRGGRGTGSFLEGQVGALGVMRERDSKAGGCGGRGRERALLLGRKSGGTEACLGQRLLPL